MKTLDNVKLSDVLPDSIAKDKNVNFSSKAIDPQLKLIAEKIDVPSIYNNLSSLESIHLDHLAYQYDIIYWDETWDVDTKREVFKASAYVHRKKGTLSALKSALAPLGYNTKVTEWFNDTPEGDPYTFRLDIELSEKSLTESTYNEVENIVETYKNTRSHMSSFTIAVCSRGRISPATAFMSGLDTAIYPYQAGDLESVDGIYIGMAEHTIDTVTVYPI